MIWNTPFGNSLLTAAEQVLRHNGITRASLSDVARELGTPTYVLRGFALNEAVLWQAVVGRKLDDVTARLSLIAEGGGNWTAEAHLCAALNSLVRASRIFQREDPALFAVYRSLSLDQARVIITFQRALIARIKAIIMRGIELREFADCDPWHASWATLNAVAPFYDPRFGKDWSSRGEHRAYKHTRALVLHGLARAAETENGNADEQMRAARALGFLLDSELGYLHPADGG